MHQHQQVQCGHIRVHAITLNKLKMIQDSVLFQITNKMQCKEYYSSDVYAEQFAVQTSLWYEINFSHFVLNLRKRGKTFLPNTNVIEAFLVVVNAVFTNYIQIKRYMSNFPHYGTLFYFSFNFHLALLYSSFYFNWYN